MQFGIDLSLSLPRRDTCLGVNDDKTGGEIAIFGRGDAAHHLDIVDVVGADLPEVRAGERCGTEGSLSHRAVVAHRHAVDDDTRSEGTRIVVHERAQLQVGQAGEVGVFDDLSGQELHDVSQ